MSTDAERPGTASFASIVAAARAGQEDAVGRLIQSVRPYLVDRARRKCSAGPSGKSNADDVVQDTLAELWLAFRTFRGRTVGEFLTWARTVQDRKLAGTRRAFLDRAKRDVRREVPLDAAAETPSPGKTPSSWARSVETAEQLDAAVDRLPPRTRQIVRLHAYEGVRFAEIARRLNVTEAAAEKAYLRALVRLGRLLRDAP